MDSYDRKILQIYQLDTRISAERIGSQVGLSAAAVQRRIRRLRDDGVIVAEIATIDCARAGLEVTVIVDVDLVDESSVATAMFRTKMDSRPEVQQCSAVAGSVDYILVVIVPNLADYEAFCNQCLSNDVNVRSFTSHVVLDPHRRWRALELSI